MGCIGSRVALFRSCSLTSGSHSGSLTSSSGGLPAVGTAVGGVSSANAAETAAQRLARRQNIFSVQNVDDTGTGISPGKLEVTETDLVLHVKGKLPLTWPLRSLRRYGFDNDLFSFESGRRCSTGAGIFAFRCHRAQSLFNLLQAKVQQAGGQGGNNSGSSSNAVGGGIVLVSATSLPTLPSTPITPTASMVTPITAISGTTRIGAAAVGAGGGGGASVPRGGAVSSSSSVVGVERLGGGGGGSGPSDSAATTTTVTTPTGSTFVYVNISEGGSSRVVSSGSAPPIPPSASSSSSFNTTGGGAISGSASTSNPLVLKSNVQTSGASSQLTPAVSSSSVSLPSSSRGPLPLTSCKPIASATSLQNHPVYMNVDSKGGALYPAASTSSTNSHPPISYSNIPPLTAPRRVSTSSEKSHHFHHPLHPHHPPPPPPPPSSSSSSSSQQISAGPSSSSTCSLIASGGTLPGGKLPDCALYSNVFCNHGNSSSTKITGTTAIPISGGIQTSSGGLVLPLPVKSESPELNYAELDLKPDSSSSQSSPFSGSRRLGLFNKHHQLVSTYSKQAEPYDTTRLASISDDTLENKEPEGAEGGVGVGGVGGATSLEQRQNELGYATIDFEKTAQLNCITRSKLSLTFEEDDTPPTKKGSSLVKKLKYGTTGL